MAYIECVGAKQGGGLDNLTKVLSESTNGTYYITDVPGYQSLTASDFIITVAKWGYAAGIGGGSTGTGGSSNVVPTITYTASSGKLVLSKCKGSATSKNAAEGSNVGRGSVTIYVDIYIEG